MSTGAMKNRNIIKAAAIFAIVAAAIPFAVAGKANFDTAVPIVFGISPMPLYQGENVNIHVGLNHPATVDQDVAINSRTPGNWSVLPAHVVIAAGQLGVDFPARISPTAAGSVEGSASCNGGTASLMCAIQAGR